MNERPYQESIDITILSGLPVTVAFCVVPPEPEVGYFQPYVEDWTITHINGRETSNPEWLYKRIDDKEAERLLNLCYDAIS